MSTNTSYKKGNGLERFIYSLLNSFFGWILFIISILAFYLPYELRIMPQISGMLTGVQEVVGAILIICFLLLYISKLRFFRDNWFIFACMAFLAVLIYATSINSGYMEGALGDQGLSALGIILALAVFVKVNPKKFLLIFYIIFLIFTVWNSYTVFAYWGTGMWHGYGAYLDDTYSLVGNYNLGIMYGIPMLMAGTVWASKYGKWLEIINYLAVISCLIMSFKCQSETQIIAFGLAVIIMVLNDIMFVWKGLYNVLRIFNSAVLLAADMAFFIIIIISRKTEWLEKIGYEAGNFHGRTNIWDAALNKILYSIDKMFGVGAYTEDAMMIAPTDAAHCHCFYLEVPLRTGIIGSVIFIIMMVLVIIAIFRAKNINVKWLLSGFLGATFLAATMESYPMPFMLLVLGFAYYVAKKDREDEIAILDLKNRKNKKQKSNPKKNKNEDYGDFSRSSDRSQSGRYDLNRPQNNREKTSRNSDRNSHPYDLNRRQPSRRDRSGAVHLLNDEYDDDNNGFENTRSFYNTQEFDRVQTHDDTQRIDGLDETRVIGVQDTADLADDDIKLREPELSGSTDLRQPISERYENQEEELANKIAENVRKLTDEN